MNIYGKRERGSEREGEKRESERAKIDGYYIWRNTRNCVLGNCTSGGQNINVVGALLSEVEGWFPALAILFHGSYSFDGLARIFDKAFRGVWVIFQGSFVTPVVI